MNKKRKTKTQTSTKIAGIAMLVFLTVGGIYFVSILFMNKSSLPVLGEPGHTAGAFSFVNQSGHLLTDKNIENKVSVVEYFFTSCPSICPTMNKNLENIYNQYKDDSDFIILSHTVDPERDSVSAMREYSKKYDASLPGWQFLTGNKDSLYEMASRDYLLSATDSAYSGFIHTQYVVLLDKKRQIRGFYDLTDKKNTPRLSKDIRSLLNEQIN
jgi:protein SCO1